MKAFSLLFILALFVFSCGPKPKNEPQKIQSFPVQYMAKVDNSQDGCGTVLCAQDDGSFCAFPRGIPQEELTAGSVFWVQGNITLKQDSPGTVNTCMGMVSNIIEVQTYIRHSF